MAILSSDKLVVVKAFAMGNPLPLDAREIWDSLAAAKEFAASNATAYLGQTIKVVESNIVTMYNLVPSDVEGENYALAFAGGGAGGVQGVGTSNIEGNISVVSVNGETTSTIDVPVVGALVNPVVDEEDHTLTLTKLGATADKNEEVVITLGGASPEDGIVSKVVLGADGVSLDITTFNPETEEETTENVKLTDIVAGAFVDVEHTADTETASAKYTFKFKDADDAEQTKVVYETGVRKVEAGSSVDKIKVTTADATGALTAAELLIGAGSVKNPEYDQETRKITLPILQADGTTQALEINLGKDMVVKTGSFDKATQEIVLVLTDDSKVKIPAASLVDIYTGGATATIAVSVSDGNVITAEVKLSTVEKNILKKDENGLYVLEDDFTETKQAIVNAQAAAEKHADDAVAQEVIDRNAAIATAKGEAIADANEYTDGQIEAEVTARDAAIATAKGEAITDANGYTDGKIAQEVTDRNAAIATAKGEANTYTDGKIEAEVTARDEAIATAKEAANEYTDQQVGAEATSRDTAIATAVGAAKTEVNGYTDTQVAGALTTAKAYTDEKVGAEATARGEAIEAAKTEVKEYADGLVAAITTTWVDFGTEA